GRGDSTVHAQLARRARLRDTPRSHRTNDGLERDARGSPHQRQPRRRAVRHVTSGRHDSHAGARVRQVERRLPWAPKRNARRRQPRGHQTRSAPTGSIRAARTAGIKLASTATTTNTIGTTTKVVVSVVLTSNSRDCKSLVLA